MILPENDPMIGHKTTRKYTKIRMPSFRASLHFSRPFPLVLILNLGILLIVGVVSGQQLSQNGASAIPHPAQPYSAEKLNPVTYTADWSLIVTPPSNTQIPKFCIPLPP